MFSSSKKAAAKLQEGDGYDDEQHLVAAVSEFKKVESSTQTMVDQLYQRLASPFQITTKPCEGSRAAVLQCYQQLQSGYASESPEQSANTDGSSNSYNGASSHSGGDAWIFIPYQQCYEAAVAYNQCVEKDTLSKHLVLVNKFEQRGAQLQMVHEAAVKTQRKEQHDVKGTV